MTDDVIDIRGLGRHFGRKEALAGVDFALKRGTVVGLIGVNGAGKTTLIKHALGLLRAERGSVRVFGLDPVADPVGVLSRVGYLSEEGDLPDWMRVWELMRYCRGMYADWDQVYADGLCESFGLGGGEKLKNLSKGQRARAGLAAALAHRPELLILDEPSSGLDPVVRRDILGAVIRTVADEGRSVLFSSHLLNEVERVADEVVLIDRGRVLAAGPCDEVKQAHRRSTVAFSEPVGEPPRLDGVFAWEGHGREWAAVHAMPAEAFAAAASRHAGRVVEERVPTLDEIFVSRVGGVSV